MLRGRRRSAAMASAEYKRLYNSKRWKDLRAIQLRGKPMCHYCSLLSKRTIAMVVDHIKPHRGDEALFFDPENLQSLCKLCHDAAKQQLEKSGVLRGCDQRGVPLDSGHHWKSV